jgi:hypothetical protein
MQSIPIVLLRAEVQMLLPRRTPAGPVWQELSRASLFRLDLVRLVKLN